MKSIVKLKITFACFCAIDLYVALSPYGENIFGGLISLAVFFGLLAIVIPHK